MKILICNAGSSSIKFGLIEAEREHLIAEAEIDWTRDSAQLSIRSQGQPVIHRQLGLRNHDDAVVRVLFELQQPGPTAPLRALDEIVAVGHRVVHGGERYTAAVRITPDVQCDINGLAELAPLHNSASLQVIEAVQRMLPGVPHIAAFDTAFHATMPESARTYPLPHAWTSDWRLRRFGFHGLSHSYCASRAAEMIPRNLRLIIAHLGNGASVSAVRHGVCVDTSMGFTPLDGLMMGTRSGSIDPGILIHVLRHKALSVDQLDHALNYESGLLGMSGISADMREVLTAATNHDDPRARLAVDVYVHRIQQTIGAMAATLGGVDVLVFTAGVGEHSPVIRQRVCENLGHLGLELDDRANVAGKPDADVARRESKARILVIATREDLAIAREVRQLIQLKDDKGELS